MRTGGYDEQESVNKKQIKDPVFFGRILVESGDAMARSKVQEDWSGEDEFKEELCKVMLAKKGEYYLKFS